MKKLLNPRKSRTLEGWLVTVHDNPDDFSVSDTFVRISTPLGVFNYLSTEEEALIAFRRRWRDMMLDVPKGVTFDVFEIYLNLLWN